MTTYWLTRFAMIPYIMEIERQRMRIAIVAAVLRNVMEGKL